MTGTGKPAGTDNEDLGVNTQSSPTVHVENLRVRRKENSLCCLDSLSVDCGERVAIVGANGSGKTTLLRVIAGLEKELTGTCRTDPSLRISMMHQHPVMFRGSVLTNTTCGLKWRGVASRERNQRAMEVLNELELNDLVSQDARTLSGGEKKRIALARALLIQPTLLLLDEPFAEVDRQGTRLMKQLLNRLDSTLIMTSPDPFGIEVGYRVIELSGAAK